MWPSSVRSFRPARDAFSADACISGSKRFPLGVRACFVRVRDPAALAAVPFFFLAIRQFGCVKKATNGGQQAVSGEYFQPPARRLLHEGQCSVAIS